ncbi:MAG: sulfotransferase domain-containing protein [Cyclobacteriaceae bacterium]
MIIIAIPKSASSSLLETVSVLHGLPSQQLDLRQLSTSSDYAGLSHIHQDIVNLEEDTYSLLSDPEHLYKQHIPPTENNIKLLRKEKKVVLLRRNLEDIILAYRRAVKKHIHQKFQDFIDCSSERDWLLRGKEIGLIDELKRFSKGWMKEASQSENCHLVYYSDLVNNPKKVLNSIEKFWRLPTSNQVILSKRRYSRHTGLQEVKADLGRKLVKLSIRIGAYDRLKAIQHLMRKTKLNYRW